MTDARDPTVLTTVQIHHEVDLLKQTIEARLDGMDRASALLHSNLMRVPNDVELQVGHLRQLLDEKFVGVERIFAEREIRRKESETASQTAISAALHSQKDAARATVLSNEAAVSKAEAATVKQLDALAVLLSTISKSFDEKIEAQRTSDAAVLASLVSRMDRSEGAERGTDKYRTGKQNDIGLMVAMVSLTVSIVATFAGFFAFSQHVTPQQLPPQTIISHTP